MKRPVLQPKIIAKIARSKQEVFLRADFADLAGYDQVGRVLRQLITEGQLIKIGYGLYAKARLNRINGEPMPSAPGGFCQVAQEALTRLGVAWSPGPATLAYQSGASTQVPANAEVVIQGRFSRTIAVNKYVLRRAIV